MKVAHGELLLPDGTVAAEADALLAAYAETGGDAGRLRCAGLEGVPG